MQRKKWVINLLGAGLCVMGGLSHTAAAPLEAQQAEQLRVEAVQLARGGDYGKSLEIFSGLEKQGYEDNAFWADYLTVLSWAGKNAELTRLADQHYAGDFSSLPDYAALPLARSFLQQGDGIRGRQLLQMLMQRGNPEAKLAYAERLLYEGDSERARQLYGELLSDKALPAHRLHFSQACAAMQRNDFIAAEEEFAAAKEAAPESQPDYARDVDAQRAAMYIQRREDDRAVNILRPYVIQGRATPNMFSDYLTALRFDNKQKEAVAAFRAYGSDWSGLPVYGLQNMADLYLRTGKYREAEALYTYILTRQDIGYVRMGRAYCLEQLGREQAALDEYRTVVEKYPALQNAVAVDGTTFLNTGKIHIARQLYQLLGNTEAEKNAYQLRYAQALSGIDRDTGSESMNFRQAELLQNREYYHEAQSVFARLAKLPAFETEAKAGLAHNKIRKGLFADGEKILDELNQKDSVNAKTYAANMANDRKMTASLRTYFETGVDYRRNRTEETGVEYQAYLGGNLYGSLGMSHYSLDDDDTHSAYNRRTEGISYRFDRGQLDLGCEHYSGPASLDGLMAGFSYEFNDVGNLAFAMGRRPHTTAAAVRSGIDERYYSLRWEQLLTNRLQLGFEYDWSSLSDTNRYRRYALDGTWLLGAGTAYRDNLLFNFSRGMYEWTSDEYDSPERRIDFAAGFSRKWNIPARERTWEWITMLGWGHDNNEGNGFEPMTRLEFTQNLKANQRLVIGAEYSWHKIAAENSDMQRRKNGYLFDVNYYLEW